MKQKLINGFLISYFISICIIKANSGSVFGKNGMIVSTTEQASKAGIEILKKGGNAIDAAVAVGFALAVTSPGNGNIGGGGFLIGKLSGGKIFSLDFREKAPQSSYRELFQDKTGNIISNMSLKSHASSGVPGSVHGLLTLLKDYGSGHLTRAEIMEPAINLAKNGFILSNEEAIKLNHDKESTFINQAARKIFYNKKRGYWKAGDRLTQTDLSKTLKKISKYGIDGFYKGSVANLIIKEMKKGNGFISINDLINYSSKYRPPVIGEYKEYEIISMGPPSSGGVLLINMLNMLENYDLKSMGWNTSEYIHILTEVERRAYADRSVHMGDPDFWNVPINILTSKTYAKNRISDIRLDEKTPSSSISASNLLDFNESPETTHFSVIDKWGNAISVTTTLNLTYGSGIVVEGAGFLLNNEMDDFVSRPGVPNYYGLIGNEANAIEPNKRPLSSMTPTIVMKNNQAYMILGSPGGSTIITSVMQVILNSLVFDMDINKAISSPRFHSQWLPDIIEYEPEKFSKNIIKSLEDKGHRLFHYRKGPYPGEVNGIMVKESGYFGTGDIRFINSATGY